MTFKLEETTTETFSFSTASGWEVGATVSVEFNIPFVGSGGVELSASTHEETTETSEIGVEKTWSYETSLTVPGGCTYTAESYCSSAQLDVPFTATMHLDSGESFTEEGTWSGVTYYTLYFEVFDVTEGGCQS